MQTQRQGRLDHASSVIVAGLAAFWTIDQAGANAALDAALAAGINHIDVAPQYGNGQKMLGPWLEARRNLFFLNCKTLERTFEGAWADLHHSFELLHTDHIDLHQFHAVTTCDELDQITAPGGAFEAFVRARDQGLVRYLGITGHGMDAPRIALEALDRMDLDSVMFPLNPRLYADAAYRADAERLLDIVRDRDLAAFVIKAVAKAPWAGRAKTAGPWYEPYVDQDDITASVQFALSQPGVSAVITPGDVQLWPALYRAAQHVTPMSAHDQAALIAARADDPLIFAGPEGVH